MRAPEIRDKVAPRKPVAPLASTAVIRTPRTLRTSNIPRTLGSLGVLALLAAAVPRDSSAAPAKAVPGDSSKDTPATAPRFTALVLRLEGAALDDLGPALALRLPDLPIVAEAPPGDAPFVFIAVRSDPRAPSRHQIGVITSDGAAYFREVDTGADAPARVLASVLANLLFSIAEGSVRPDRTDVEIPPENAPMPGPAPTPEPTSATTPPPGPTPGATKPPVPRDSPRPSLPPRWDLGLVASGVLGIPAGKPSFGPAIAGGGGSLGLDARSPRSLLVGGELRVLGRSAEDHRLVRLRVTALAGYVLRRGRFELPLALGLTIEPWWVSPATAVTATRGARPLLGGLLRASPGLYIVLPGRRPRALRVGPRLELAGSFAVDDGAKVVGVSLGQGDSNRALFRLGGLELAVGLELALWFGRRGRAAPR